MKKIRLLKSSEIECRIGTIKTKGCSLLLFKDARVDMNILDETFENDGWQRDHKELKGNIYCGIGIWDENKKQWIWKWDCGKESFNESEKGEASDSFKRAGFNVGIGRELYTSPFIWITPKQSGEFYEDKGKIKTDTIFKVDTIGYDENRNINKLIIRDNKNTIRFTFGDVKEEAGLDTETLRLRSDFMNLVVSTDTDLKLILDTYKVGDTTDLSKAQLIQAINRMKEKGNKNE